MKKSRRGRVHVGRPLIPRGWQLPATWTLIARRGQGHDFEMMFGKAKTREEALGRAKELLERGWETVEVKMKEDLHPRRA